MNDLRFQELSSSCDEVAFDKIKLLLDNAAYEYHFTGNAASSIFTRNTIESEVLIIFGYSGLDTHLNEIIKKNSSNKKIRVVEWIGEDSNSDRLMYWSQLFNSSNLILTQCENILGFKNWLFNIQSDADTSEED